MPASNLPTQPTSFIGRENELAEITTLLTDPACRLLTLVGAGGIGKTRLAIQSAVSQQPHFADGVHFVPLAPVASADLLPAAIAGALSVSFFGLEDPRRQIARYLSEKQICLVMDNFEHLLEGVGLLTELLQSAPNLKIFATSRERMNLQEEWVFTLDGLSYPKESFSGTLEHYSAVKLFLQRARQVNNHFTLDGNESAVQSICRQVEGMPLSLELAASWLRGMSCQQIEAKVAGNIDFLTTPVRNIPERHRSLRTVFTHSWNLLSNNEQNVLMKLSVFRGGFDLEAAEQVAGASLPDLVSLADKSLIRLNAYGRYDLHELLRQYAADQLLAAGMSNITTQQHIDYFLNLAEQMEAHLFGRDQIMWFDRLEVELDNLRTALTRSAESETGLRLAAALGWFLIERTRWKEGRTWLEQMLMANPDAPSSLRAKALHTTAALASMLDDIQYAQTMGTQALALARATNDRWNMAWALCHLGITPQSNRANYSIALLEESLALFRELEDHMGMTHALIRLSSSVIETDQPNYAYARQLLEEATIHAHNAGDHITIGWVTNFNGWLYWQENHNFEKAISYIENSLSLFRESHFPVGINHSLMLLAQIEHERGNGKKAQMRYGQVLMSLENSTPNHPYLPGVLVRIASLARTAGMLERSAKLLGAANRTTFDAKPNSVEYISHHKNIVPPPLPLGETAFAEAWAAGKDMTREQSIVFALEGSAMFAETTVTIHSADQPLTQREDEILRLTAEGLNSREVAERLVLSVETIRWYLKLIYSKLDVHSRSEAIARAKALKLLV